MNTYLIGFIVAIAIVGGGWYVYVSQSSSPQEQSEQSREKMADQQSETSMEVSTIAALFAKEQQLICEVEEEENGEMQSGTIYVDEGRLRGDFVIETKEGETSDSHMIHDGEWVYVWGATGLREVQGLKMRIENVEDIDTEEGVKDMVVAQPFSQNEEIDMDCRAWSGDDQKFERPEDVSFMDVSASILPEVSAETNGFDQCATCEQLPDAQQDSCLQALGC